MSSNYTVLFLSRQLDPKDSNRQTGPPPCRTGRSFSGFHPTQRIVLQLSGGTAAEFLHPAVFGIAAVNRPDIRQTLQLLQHKINEGILGLNAVTYTLYAKASTGLSALETVLLPIIDPVLNPVWVFLFIGEAPGPLSLLGSGAILITVTARVACGLTRQPEHI